MAPVVGEEFCCTSSGGDTFDVGGTGSGSSSSKGSTIAKPTAAAVSVARIPAAIHGPRFVAVGTGAGPGDDDQGSTRDGGALPAGVDAPGFHAVGAPEMSTGLGVF